MRQRLIPVVVFALAGIILGWLARGYFDGDEVSLPHSPPTASREQSPDSELVTEPAGSAIEFLHAVEDEAPIDRIRAIESWVAGNGHTFYTLLALAAANAEVDGYDEAVQLLLDAAIEAGNDAEQAQLERALDLITGDYARVLVAANRFDEVDRMYERVTLALPELSGYFMELGELRLRLGNTQGALMTLAQIQNDSELGARARELMAQAEASEAIPVANAEELPLAVAGNQFVVRARLDDEAFVSLLIDTGAAMTIIKTDTLARLGYRLNGRRELFATAGGVVEAPVVTLSSLALGSSTIHQLPVGAMSLEISGGIDGLLGMNYLRHFDFRIDQDQGVLYLDAAGR